MKKKSLVGWVRKNWQQEFLFIEIENNYNKIFVPNVYKYKKSLIPWYRLTKKVRITIQELPDRSER